MPVFFNYGPNEYFLVGLGVSSVTVPFIFVGGIISSLLIEHFSKRQQWWLSYLKHIGSSLICIAVFLLYVRVNGGLAIDLAEIALIIGIIYTTIFVITDSITKIIKGKS